MMRVWNVWERPSRCVPRCHGVLLELSRGGSAQVPLSHRTCLLDRESDAASDD